MASKSKPAATKKAKAKPKFTVKDLKPKKDARGGLVEGGKTIIKAPIYTRGWDV